MRCVALAGLLLLVACQTRNECWDPRLDQADTTGPACVAAPYLVECALSDGSGETCLSDSPTRCDDTPVVGATQVSCASQCGMFEYAVSCGGGASHEAAPTPPAACRSWGVVPAGVVLYCCPCD
jgi:hypothetical protein